MRDQSIVGLHFAQEDALLEQQFGSSHLRRSRYHVDECADEVEADADVVVALGVRADFVPAAAFVDAAVATHHEIVSNVSPAKTLNVVHLHFPHLKYG